jgi:hypothetical protein
MAEARKLGGVRRKREVTLAGAYDFEGLDTVHQLRRLLLVVAFDMLSLENSVARARVIVAIVLTGAKLLEVGEFAERLAALEAAVDGNRQRPDSLYDQPDDFAREAD